MVPNVKISSVEFVNDYQIDILLTSGHHILYNLGPKLTTARFKKIEGKETFNSGRVVGGNRIVWDFSTELSLDEILWNVCEQKNYE